MLNSSMQEFLTVEQDGTQVHIGQELSHAPISQTPDEVLIEEKEPNRTEESVLTMKLEEQISIQTLVTLPISTSHIRSQTLHRPSVDDTPLQSSRPSPDTSKVGEGKSYRDFDLDEVIELVKFDLTTITIE